MAAERIMSSSSSCGSLQDVGDGDDTKQSAAGVTREVKDSKNAGGGAGVSGNKKDAKKGKPAKLDRRDPQRFFGEGINFKAKLIGVRDVPQARGERMAHDALQELKIQKRTSGEHKQKININISLEGLKIRDEKTKDILFLHPVHKISFISQDAADNRAFGYIYGSPDNVHTFYAIKTEKAALHLVMCMKNLFQIAYEMKKKEIEQWRMQQVQQQVDNGAQMNHSPSTSLGSSNSNDYASISEGSASSRQNDVQFPMSTSSDSSSNSSSIGVSDSVSNGSHNDNRSSGSDSMWQGERPNVVTSSNSGAELLLDLTMDESMRSANFTAAAAKNFGANPMHQPPHHHDPFFSDPWGYLSSMSDSNDANNSNDDPFLVAPNVANTPVMSNAFFPPATTTKAADFSRFQTADPFNTNFVTMPFSNCTSTPATTFPISPVAIATTNWDTNSVNPQQAEVPSGDKYAALAEIIATTTSTADDDIYGVRQPFDGSSTDCSAADSQSGSTGSESGDLVSSFAAISASDEPLFGTSFPNQLSADNWLQMATSPPQAAISPFVFSDLDPLGKDRPYVDKKDFFQDVKNPPKKVLKDLVAENSFDLGGDLTVEHRRPHPSDPFTSSYSDDDDDDSTSESALPPPTIPPPLPPPLSLRKRSPSPASSLEDTSMQDSSSNSSRGTASPTVDFAPPPLPPPRPHMGLLPPPPAVPHKHHPQPPPPHNLRRDASPFAKDKNHPSSIMSLYETDNCKGADARLGGHLSSPPIPIPGRRGRSPMATTTTSSSSTSMSSAASSVTSTSSSNNVRGGNANMHHPLLATSLPSPGVPDPNNNPMHRRRRTTASPARQSGDFGFWTGGLTTSNINVTGGGQSTQWSTGSGLDVHQNELTNVLAGSTNNSRGQNQLINVGNSFSTAKDGVILNPPPQSRRLTTNRRAGTKEDIFHKEEDPFADDEFFAILKTHNSQNAKSPELVSTPNLNTPAVWNNPFAENVIKNI